jgi:DNA-binding transcriptional MerR regulator
MERLSIRQVSEQLQVSKDSLRYYDKLGIVCPKRGENNYRYYTNQDLLDLQYVQVLCFTGFTLSEVSQLIKLMKSCDANDFPLILALMKKKREGLAKRLVVFQSMIEYIDETEALYSEKAGADVSKINALAMKMFLEMKELREEQKT